MKPISHLMEYLDTERILSFKNTLSNGLIIDVYVQILSEKFIEFQKELIQDFIADFVDKVSDPALSLDEVQALFEQGLQGLNSKLSSFVEKLRDIQRCPINGYIQIISEQTLISSMIGKTTLVIFRNDKINYSLENSVDEKGAIDLFSDFIWWELERGDALLYAGVKMSEVLDQHDIIEMENILKNDNVEVMLEFFSETLLNRIEKEQIWFLSLFSITGLVIQSKSMLSKLPIKYGSKFLQNFYDAHFIKNAKKIFFWNKYYIMSFVSIVAVLFLAGTLLAQVYKGDKNKIFYTGADQKQIEVTIPGLSKDIVDFQTLEAKSDEKSIKYEEILKKIALLEEEGKWLEDVKTLKARVEKEHKSGFWVHTFDTLSESKEGGKVLSFNNTEKNKLGKPLSIAAGNTIHIGGEQASIIGAINDSTRGSLIEHNLGSDAKGCTLSLTKKGLFCYTTSGLLFLVNKVGIETMESQDGDRSTNNIWGIGTYGNNNLYLFQSDSQNIASVFLTRYRNLPGSESKYGNGGNYVVMTNTGNTLPAKLWGFAIDENFLAWGDGKLYQLWRPSNAANRLDFRQVSLVGGDKVLSSYSDNVKILAFDNSPYVYLFDRDNQSFTVYESSPDKTNKNYKNNFRLHYLFMFKFILTKQNLTILDVDIPKSVSTNPELYLLTNEGINKINLHDLITVHKENRKKTQ